MFIDGASFFIGSDEELSGDDDDPDLLNELSEITGNEGENESEKPQEVPPSAAPASLNSTAEQDQSIVPTTTLNTVELLKSRLEMYRQAEKIAKQSNDNTRARSRARGIKTIESLLKQALAGKTINADDIPPVVSTTAPKVQPTSAEAIPASNADAPNEVHQDSVKSTEPEKQQSPVIVAETVEPSNVETKEIDETKINALLERQREYKMAALNAKKSCDTAMALQFVKIIKIFDTVLSSARNGESVDLSDMPPHPSELSSKVLNAIGQPSTPLTQPAKQENTLQQSENVNVPELAEVQPIPQAQPTESPPIEEPATVLDALMQRLQKYQALEASAKADGNDRKVRQNGRIVKQYQDAIRAHKAGKVVAYDELPTPPGFSPIPSNVQQKPAPPAAPSAPPKQDDASPENSSPTKSPLKKQDSRVSGNHSNTSIMNKTIELLLERQKEFKEAALEAKKAGEIEQAKEFLKTFKGIDNLLNVARGGLPVDLSTVRF